MKKSDENNNKVSIVIPTRNRPEYVERIIDYYQKYGKNFNLIVADSSTDQNKKKNEKTISSYSQENIVHLKYDFSEDEHLNRVFEKTADGVRHATTPYCVQCADDDFATPSGINHAVKFLEKNPEYVVAVGKSMGFKLIYDTNNNQQFYWRTRPLLKSIDFPDPESRWLYYLYNYAYYPSPDTGVVRTDILKMMYEEAAKYTSDNSFGEILSITLPLIHGKMKTMDVLHVAREHRPPDCLSHRVEKLYDFVANGIYDTKYDSFKECLVKHLSKKSQITRKKAEKIIEKGWTEFINKRYKGFIDCRISYLLKSMKMPSAVDEGVRKTYRKMFKRQKKRDDFSSWINNASKDDLPKGWLQEYNHIKNQVLLFSKK